MMSSRAPSAESSFCFGPFRLVPQRQVLLRGDTPVNIGHRALEVLTALVMQAGKVVEKEALIARIWPCTLVEPGNVKVHVSALRKELARHAPGIDFVETVPGVGYRFVAPVDVERASDHARVTLADNTGAGETVLRFGDFRFLPTRHALFKGAERQRIGGRALDLLHLLLERAGQLVTKDELTQFAWPRAHIHEANLKVNIAALRRTLASPGDLPIIATVPGRGYRFVAPVISESMVSAAGDDARLPRPSQLIGREHDREAVRVLLFESRFTTIAGAAGVGKTSVALAVAKDGGVQWPDGAYFVDLAAVGDAQLVGAAVATAMGVGASMSNLLLGIVEAVQRRRVLLVLDNCEHVRSAVTVVAEYLHGASPGMTILATSREPLGAVLETIYRLAPLAFSDDTARLDAVHAMTYPAVQLFVRRASEAVAYELTDADAPAIAEICRRLDGIPLAIELAASRLTSFRPAELLSRLEQSMMALAFGPRSAPLRQQTLSATLDWSYQLLSPREAKILRWMSTFASEFTLADLVRVTEPLSIPAEMVAMTADSMAAKSLVSVTYVDGGLTYRLLEILREYAAARLEADDEALDARASHAGYITEIIERAEREWRWRPGEEWIASYARRANDLRKAIDWAFGDGRQPLLGVRLTAAAIPLWDELSSVGESRQRIDSALAHVQRLVGVDPTFVMKLTTARAWGLTFVESLRPEAEDAWQDSLRLALGTRDVDYQLRSLWGLAVFQSFTGRHRSALATLGRFAAIAQAEDELASIPDGQRLRYMTAFYCGEISTAYEGLQRLAAEHARDAHRSRLARFQIDRSVGIRVSLSTVAWVRGEHRRAGAYSLEALERAARLGHVVSHANALAQAALPLAAWNGSAEMLLRYATLLEDHLKQRALGIWSPVCRFYRGAAVSIEGDPGGVTMMRTAVEDLVASRFLVRVPMYFAMLADAAIRHGDFAVAQTSLASALHRMERQDERWPHAEIVRLQGKLAWHGGDFHGARNALRRAIVIANAADARSFALRAAIDLVDLMAATGRGAEGLAVIGPILLSFDDTDDSTDLARARQWVGAHRR